jgi:aldehyde dehydrogenase (NAD+)
MKLLDSARLVPHPDQFFIDGNWVSPSTDDAFDVDDSATEEVFTRVAAAGSADMGRAITAARTAFDHGPWPRLSHPQRAEYLSAIAAGLRKRGPDFGQTWPRESGVLHAIASGVGAGTADMFDYYAGLAADYPFEEPARPAVGAYGLIRHEPVGVVGAIVPWNGPLGLITIKLAPALLAGCTVVVKSSPEAPCEGQIMAEIIEEAGLPPGVVNFLTADRAVSEELVRDPRVDKIAFTGSTAAGRRIAALCGERIARYTLELGGKSAAVVLDDIAVEQAAMTLAAAECRLSGQVCASLTRIIVSRSRHDELVESLASHFSQYRLGDPFDVSTEMGPLASRRQRDRVEGYITQGVEAGAVLATGGGRPKELDRGWFIEPTVFGNVDNASVIGQEEIFGPVLCVIPAADEADAITIANDTIYGLNAAVFTNDTDRALHVARQLRSGTVGHNGYRLELGMGVGGFKQSGVGREGGRAGLLPYLEQKSVILDGVPSGAPEPSA